MEPSYKFFFNKACKYFPCHKTKDPEKFNCLFCFCPLYLMGKECGGNFKYYGNIKDCSDCLIPHGPDQYEYILNKLKEYNQKKAEADQE